jgi:hypothetical protein
VFSERDAPFFSGCASAVLAAIVKPNLDATAQKANFPPMTSCPDFAGVSLQRHKPFDSGDWVADASSTAPAERLS